MEIWIASYIRANFKKLKVPIRKHVYFCLADHYEPYFKNVEQSTARGLVDDWVKNYREVASNHCDSKGMPPKHSYFYPIEEYDEYILEQLANITKDGFGDVDIHLHHDDDTAENLEKTLNNFKSLLFDKHNLLRKDESGQIVYGFIHGEYEISGTRIIEYNAKKYYLLHICDYTMIFDDEQYFEYKKFIKNKRVSECGCFIRGDHNINGLY